MTFQQAFTEWAAIPQNVALAAKSRTPVQNVLLKDHGERDIREFTADFVGKLTNSCPESHAHKVKAISILVHTLLWASELGFCDKPDFDFGIVSDKEQLPVNTTADHDHIQEETLGTAVTPKCSSRDEFGHFKKGIKPWNADKHPGCFGGRPMVSVTQLDPETLQVVATYNNMADAKKQTGTNNISRALRNHLLANGYYWCRTGEEKTFKPGYVRGPNNRKSAKNRKVRATRGNSYPRSGPGVPDEKSGREGRSSMRDSASPFNARETSLSLFSVTELRTELERRGWYGTLYQRLEFIVNREQSDKMI